MSSVLIVEDDLQQCMFLKQTLSVAYPNWTIDSACSLFEAEQLLHQAKQTYSLFLLDIQLSSDKDNRDGFQFAAEIRKIKPYYTSPILFLTSISDEINYGLSQFHCYNYITKPYTSEDILSQIKHLLFSGILKDSLTIKDTSNIYHKVDLSDIILCEGKSRLLFLHTFLDKLETKNYTLNTIAALLPSQFVQCHRRFIVNQDYIKSFDFTNNYIQIANHSIPIGRTYVSKVKHIL